MSAVAAFPSTLGIAHWRIAVFALLLALTLYRLAVIQTGGVPLFFDEAYYYGWAQAPAWGYYSKPPMVAWLIASSTWLLGDSPLAVKLWSPLLYAGTALFGYLIGRRLFGEGVGLAAAVTLATVPGVGISALFISSDAPLLFFWSATAYGFLRARDAPGYGWWIVAGLGGGLGLLSKYTMLALPLSLALYLAGSRRHRRLLAAPGFWLAVLVALLVFAPNLAWNLRHGFVTLAHHRELSQAEGGLLHPEQLLEFLAGQILVIGPLLAIPLIGLLAAPRRWRDPDGRWYALALTLPLIALVSLQALMARANVNWAMPAAIGGSLLACALLLGRGRRRWLALAVAVNLASTAVVYHYHGLAGLLNVPLSARSDPYARLLGWPEATAAVAQRFLSAYPALPVAGTDRAVLANLVYYGRLPPTRLVSWNPRGEPRHQYDLAADMARHPGGSFLFVHDRPLEPGVLERFEAARPLGRVTVAVYPDLQRRLYVYLLEGFRGYG